MRAAEGGDRGEKAKSLIAVSHLDRNNNILRRHKVRLAPTLRDARVSENCCIVPDWPLGSHNVPLNSDAELSPLGLARLIADFLAALRLEPVTLVGNDTGGALCQIVAAEYPQHIARLVLTNCDAFDNFLPPTFRYLQWGARIPGFVFLTAQAMRWPAVRRLPNAFG